jgi:hypothetical protein
VGSSEERRRRKREPEPGEQVGRRRGKKGNKGQRTQAELSASDLRDIPR